MSDTGDMRLDLLLFSVCGVHFGIDAGQVSGIALYGGEQADDLFWFHEEVGFGNRAITYLSPTIVTIRTPASQPYRVVIDMMEDITGFSRNDIRLFPALLEHFVLRSGMWGVVVKDGGLILLVDFLRLLNNRRPDAT